MQTVFSKVHPACQNIVNNVAKGIRLLDKKHFLFIQENLMQVRALERYIPLKGFYQ